MPQKLFYIYSFPRSGSHYLQALIMSRFNSLPNLFHNLEMYSSSQHVVSIIRNPVDAIASDAAITVNHKKDIVANKHSYNIILPLLVDRLDQNYVDTLTTIYNKSDIIIDFNDLISRPDDVMNAIARKLDIPIGNQEDVTVGNQSSLGAGPEFIQSATGLDYYDLTKLRVSQMGVSNEAMDMYSLLLSKAIKL